jgi:vacuolar-type H+-ATPase subunit I/STV1
MPDDNDTNDQPQYVTMEQLHSVINSALSNRSKGTSKEISELKTMLSQLTQPKEEVKEEPVPKKDEIYKQLNEYKKLVDDLKKERDEHKSKSKVERLNSTVRDFLTKSGVPAHQLKAAVAVLKEDGLLGYDEEDEDRLVFKSGAEVLDIQEGLKSWLKGDDGKYFVPSKNPKGSGSLKPSGLQSNVKQDYSEDEVAESLMSILKNM